MSIHVFCTIISLSSTNYTIQGPYCLFIILSVYFFRYGMSTYYPKVFQEIGKFYWMPYFSQGSGESVHDHHYNFVSLYNLSEALTFLPERIEQNIVFSVLLLEKVGFIAFITKSRLYPFLFVDMRSMAPRPGDIFASTCAPLHHSLLYSQFCQCHSLRHNCGEQINFKRSFKC